MDKRTLNTFEELEKSAKQDYHGFIRSGERFYVVALEDSLPYGEIKDYLHDKTIKEYLDRRRDVILKDFENKQIRINRPIEDVIAHFNDPKSKMRVIARKELRERFLGLAWQEQLKVLYAMLGTGTLLDLVWVADMCNGAYSTYLQALDHFFPEEHHKFCDHLEQCCLKRLSNPKVANYIVNHSQPELISEHFDTLVNTVGYRKVALRLAYYNRDFVIDKSRMNLLQYADVCAQTNRPIKKPELWNDFRNWILELGEYNIRWTRQIEFMPSESNSDVNVNLRLADIDEVRWLLKSCASMNLHDVICAIYEFDCLVYDKLNRTFREDVANNNLPLSQYDLDKHYRGLLLEYAKEMITSFDPNLSKDFTVYDKVKKHYEHMKVVEVSADEQTFRHGDTVFRVVTNENNNTFRLEKDLPTQFSQVPDAELNECIEKVNETYHFISLSDDKSAIRSDVLPMYHCGIAKTVIRSFYKRFVSAYYLLESELKKN